MRAGGRHTALGALTLVAAAPPFLGAGVGTGSTPGPEEGGGGEIPARGKIIPFLNIRMGNASKPGCGHTAGKAPEPVRFQQLSPARLCQYWGGRPPGNAECRILLFFFLEVFLLMRNVYAGTAWWPF